MKIYKRKWLWFFLLLVGFGAWLWFNRETAPSYSTEQVRRGNIAQIVNVSGVLKPFSYADLSFQRSGSVRRIYALQGDYIAQGDMIAELDTDVIDAQLNEALVAFRIAEENEKLARRNWNDLKPEERQAKKLETEQSRRAVDAIRAEKKQSALFSPVDGILSSVDMRSGETVLLGEKVGRVTEKSDLIVETDVPESDIVNITFGQRAEVHFDALDSHEDTFSASVVRIDREATVVQDVVYYKVRLSLDNQDSRLQSGMSVDADIQVSEKRDVLIIPRRAVREEGSKSFVNILTADQRPEKREVQTGIRDEEGNVEIISGVEENDVLVIEQKSK